MKEVQDWVIEETRKADFGDKRLNMRYGDILNSLASAPKDSIPGSCRSWKETIAAYRFFNHEDITSSGILLPHREATVERIKKEKTVLVVQDTTEIDFSKRKPMLGMGYLNDYASQGFYIHPSIAVTPERTCLGVIDMQSWAREALGSRNERNKKPLEEKETYCWLKGYEAANKVALEAPDTVVVSVADREGDIYELLTKSPSELNKAYWLVRAQHNRIVVNESNRKMKDAIKASKPVGEIEFSLPAGRIYSRIGHKRKARKERVVRQEVRTCLVRLCPREGEDPVPLYVVHCTEINAPTEEEKIEWYLLTSFPVTEVETALEIVQWYLCRWQIEVFFKILKSGCTVEELQFDSLKATSNCIAVYLIVAWRILYLTMLGRNCPDIPCDVVFEINEWHSVYAIVTKKTPPKKPPTLNAIILMIAKLGGFLGRKSDGYPGPKVMWIGMQRMKDFTTAWETFSSMDLKRCV